MSKIVKMIFGDPTKKLLQELQKDAAIIQEYEAALKEISDTDLKAKTEAFKKRIEEGATFDEILHEAYAVVREAAIRVLGLRHYDVQMIGGIVMHRAGIAEMRTGEGKTLTATLPLYLNALSGKGCHLVTVNDYLAKRDCVWMGQVYNFLGLSVGCIQRETGYVYDPEFKEEINEDEQDSTSSFKVRQDYLKPASRADAYNADITYGTNNEFGFDYLRDNMVMEKSQKVQRDFHFCIIDEVDSILIDEARTPLIISAPAEESNEMYMKFSQIARVLQEDIDYNVDEKMRASTLTAEGIEKIEKALGVENLYAAGGIQMVHHAEQALRAHALYQKDRDYVVKDDEVIIVDEFTGRLMVGRRYSEGLHQAIEAKEGVKINRESQTLATVTFQNFFRMYDKLAGMSGTAITEAEEFGKIYDLDVTAIPTNRPDQRADGADRIYKNEAGKFKAVIRDVKKLQEEGKAVLVGTASIDKNELLSKLLTKAGIKHEALNAKNHEREAEIIAQAGRAGSVTLATNMAGRGVDIILGGNPPSPEMASKIKERGGLHVLGTERHESRRIDNQLRGRSARQGDPGVTQFYVSMEDPLMRIFGSDRVRGMMDKLGIADDQPIETKMVSKSIEKAQHRVEGHHFDMRKHLLEYDDVLNKHRELVYRRRDEVLVAYDTDNEDVFREQLLDLVEDEVEQVVLFHTGEIMIDDSKEEKSGDWDVTEIIEVVNTIIPLDKSRQNVLETLVLKASEDKQHAAEQRTKIIKKVMEFVGEAYTILEEQYDDRKKLKDVERSVILRASDRLWIDHLAAMTALRTGIGLQGYGQRDPLIEYKKESFIMFNRLLSSINQEIVYNFFKYAAHLIRSEQQAVLGKSLLERVGVKLAGAKKTSDNGESENPANEVLEQKVGRNDPCPCGATRSDGTIKKYKKCHGKNV